MGETTQEQVHDSIPYDRFQQVIGERNEWKKRLEAAELARAGLEAEQKTAAEQLSKYEQELTSARLNTLRLKVAAGKGIALELADRLVGTSAEELATDADRFAALLKPREGPGIPPAGRGSAVSFDMSRMTPEEIRQARDRILNGG